MQLKKHEIDMVNDSVGSVVKNQKGETMGFVAGVLNITTQESAEYIVLANNHLFGSSTRYFAVPACSEMIQVTRESVKMAIDKDHLINAKRILSEECPKPLFDFEPLIYELTDFHNSGEQVS